MPRYFIRLSYNGTAYNGWQSQPHKGTKTVQTTLDDAISTLLRSQVNLVGCGRTDTGVHAMDYFAHFDIEKKIKVDELTYKVNKLLPGDIAVQKFILVSDQAHTRFDAISRSYQYHLHTQKSPFNTNSFYYKYDTPDIEILNQAAKILFDYSDFATFCKLKSDVLTTECSILESYWVKDGDKYTYYIKADRFLRGMIRLVVGMCLNVSRGKLKLDEVKKALESKTRTGHDWSVPPEGLFLYDIRYPYL